MSSKDASTVPAPSCATLTERVVAPDLEREAQSGSVPISAGLTPEFALGDAMVEQQAKAVLAEDMQLCPTANRGQRELVFPDWLDRRIRRSVARKCATVHEVLGWIIAGGLALVTVAKHSVTPVAYLLLAGFARPRAAETELLEAELRRASLRKYPAE